MNALRGTGPLIRLILRRERLALPLWLGFLTVLVLGVFQGISGLYSSEAARLVLTQQVNGTPAEVALLGRVLSGSLGGVVAWRVSLSAGVLIGVMGLLTVTRQTRGEEENGRADLVRAGAVGRQAPLSAALLVACGTCLLLGGLWALLLWALGLPLAGSLALGLALGACGCTFSALAGLTAQLASTARTANLLAGSLLGATYLLRVLGDSMGGMGDSMGGVGGMGAAWLSWLSPLAWVRLVRPFAGERWWVLGLFVALSAALMALAYGLSARRDLGLGLLPTRAGPATAAPGLRSPLALAWRLQRGGLLTWTVAFGVLGAVFGGVATSAAGQIGGLGRLADRTLADGAGTGGVSPTDVLFTLVLAILGGGLVTVYAIGAALRLRAEELAGRADPLLSLPVTRLQWATSHLVFAALGPALLLAAFGLAAGLTFGLSSGQTLHQVTRLTLAALAYLPAVWVLAAVGTALMGWLPRWSALAWGTLAAATLLDLSAELHLLGNALPQLSPFAHVPNLLLGEGLSTPYVGLLLLAAFLALMGLLGLKRRDLN